MPLALALTAVLLGQAEAEAPAEASSITAALVAPSPHVGKGHFTFGTHGNLSYLAGAASTLNFSLGVSAGYFVHDRVLLGGNLGFDLSTFSGAVFPGTTATLVGIPLGVFGQYWHPLGERLFLFAGASIGLIPTFGGRPAIFWAVTPRVGVAIFLTDWLALEPSISTAFSGSGTGQFSVIVGLGWGMGYFL